ncbi:serine/threonine-protein kinase [Haloactinomyces albus]|uniref:non-specific serine/threonine protein kinase n=1 Tax=Haloactinomyces albus TaxID=1352928 RepID=A0AAE4CPR8_9ACTN|nr:protein kinase [Haloactinomyces albus]MDR7301993.1 serine/threonine-protein kinase [Haloactinomyces albus]
MPTSGHLLAERYRLDQRIAVGGMGEVWQAVDVRLDRTVAVKVLKAELCGDAEFLHRFRTEARTTASLNHPGIAAVHDYGETAATPDGPEDTAYLVMELVEGEPLAAILAREGRITSEHTLEMLEQAGNALQAAHGRSLVHRDVKPGNILVTPTGTIKITDFGIAKAADAAPVTRSGTVMGTAHYISPEQALGNDATPASDVYSLAVVGYECLMGHRPFLSDNAVTVAMMHIREVAPLLPPDVPRNVRALIEATLVKDPRYRYSGGGEFANAVSSVRAGGPLPAPAALTVPPQQQRQTQQSTAAHNTGISRPPGGGPGTAQTPPPAGGVPPNPSVSAPAAPASGHPSVGAVGAGVPPVGSGMQRTGAYPSGVFPPPTPPPTPPPAPPDRANRIGLWVFLAVVIIVVLIVGSVATWRVATQSSPSPRPAATDRSTRSLAEGNSRNDHAGVRFVGMDSGARLGQTALRHPGSGRAAPQRSSAGQPTTSRKTTHAKEVGGTAHRAPAGRREVTGPRLPRDYGSA